MTKREKIIERAKRLKVKNERTKNVYFKDTIDYAITTFVDRTVDKLSDRLLDGLLARREMDSK